MYVTRTNADVEKHNVKISLIRKLKYPAHIPQWVLRYLKDIKAILPIFHLLILIMISV